MDKKRTDHNEILLRKIIIVILKRIWRKIYEGDFLNFEKLYSMVILYKTKPMALYNLDILWELKHFYK